MKCEDCGEQDATVHFTELAESEKREMHLCEKCARKKSIPMQKAISLSDLLQNLLAHVGSKEDEALSAIACPTCGLTYGDFRSTGRFGCPNDYEVFRQGLTDILVKVQHDTRHVGKVPPQAGDDLRRQNEVIRLRRELERAAQSEQYERAAELRDRIAELTRPKRET